MSGRGKGFSAVEASDPTPAQGALFEVVLAAQMTDDTYQALHSKADNVPEKVSEEGRERKRAERAMTEDKKGKRRTRL